MAVDHLGKLLASMNNFIKNLAGLGISVFSQDDHVLADLLKLFENTANPNTVLRIRELKENHFMVPEGFDEKISLLVQERYAKNMSVVPAGSFIMGTQKDKIDEYINGIPDPDKRPPLSFFDGQYPQKEVAIDEFLIDKFLVTNAEYQEFKPDFVFEASKEKHPVVGISYYDALEYAHWVGKDLPSEEEWEKAARGIDGRAFPWEIIGNLKRKVGMKYVILVIQVTRELLQLTCFLLG